MIIITLQRIFVVCFNDWNLFSSPV